MRALIVNLDKHYEKFGDARLQEIDGETVDTYKGFCDWFDLPDCGIGGTIYETLGCSSEFEIADVEFDSIEFDYDDTVSIDGSYPLFFQLDTELFESTFSELAKGNFVIEDYSDTRFEGSITAEENEIVMTTIPYDKYWKVYVDGERVETYEVLDSLLAFDITAGEHEIELRYSSTMFNVGITVSIIGLAIFVVMCVFEEKIRRLTIKSAKKVDDGEENREFDGKLPIENDGNCADDLTTTTEKDENL